MSLDPGFCKGSKSVSEFTPLFIRIALKSKAGVIIQLEILMNDIYRHVFCKMEVLC